MAQVKPSLGDLVRLIPNFDTLSHVEKIKVFAWYIHAIKDHDRFGTTDIRDCYVEVNVNPPVNISSSLADLNTRRDKAILKDSRGYRLEKRERDKLDAKYGRRPTAIVVDNLLETLPSKVQSRVEQSFLREALICFQHGAFRAAIIMSWILAFDHLCNYIIDNRLSQFNQQLPKTYPKSFITNVLTRDDLSSLKESEVLQVCKSSRIITDDVYKILKEKLDRRNTAAHPSGVVVTQLQAEDYITDLVNNVVCKLA